MRKDSRDEYNYERNRRALWNSRNLIKREQTADFQELQKLIAMQADINNRIQEVLGRIQEREKNVSAIVEEQMNAMGKEKEEKRRQAIELAKGQSQQSQADIVRAALAKEPEDDELDR